MSVSAIVSGTGRSVPDRVLTNADLEKIVDTSDEWITTRTGIKERRIAADGEALSKYASEAGRKALEAAGVRVAESPTQIPRMLLEAGVSTD